MKKIISIICIVLVFVSTLVVPALAEAGDIYAYYGAYVEAGEWHYTYWHYKTDDDPVYVYPGIAPTYYTAVRTCCIDKQYYNYSNKTSAVTAYLPYQTMCGIYNNVYYGGSYTAGQGVNMNLAITPGAGAGTIGGWWSPDIQPEYTPSSNNYF